MVTIATDIVASGYRKHSKAGVLYLLSANISIENVYTRWVITVLYTGVTTQPGGP